MSKVIRVFCQSEETPSLRDIMEYLIEEKVHLALDEETLEADADSPEWHTADLLIEESKTAVQFDCYRAEDDPDGHFDEIRGQFAHKFQGDKEEEEKEIIEADAIRDHLAATTYIVQIQIPLDADEICREMVDLIAQTLAANESGIIQIEGEGFLDSDGEQMLELE